MVGEWRELKKGTQGTTPSTGADACVVRPRVLDAERRHFSHCSRTHFSDSPQPFGHPKDSLAPASSVPALKHEAGFLV